MSRKLSRRASGLLAAMAVCGLAPVAVRAGTMVNYNAEPGSEHSFIDDTNGQFAMSDNTFAATLTAAAKNWDVDNVDFMTNICYGGGFADQVSSSLAAANIDYSSAAASQYNGPAYSFMGTVLNGASPRNGTTYYENFTAAWAEAQGTVANEPMDSAFVAADSNGNAQISMADSSSSDNPANAPANNPNGPLETPTYISGGTGDADTLDGADEWAVLICADAPDGVPNFRHDINLDRIYNNLLTDGVPPTHIEILYSAGGVNLFNPNGALGYARDSNDSNNGLPLTPITATTNAGNTMANLQNAFSMNANYFGVQPAANSSLFVYMTGHGGHTSSIPVGTVGFNNAPEFLQVRYAVPIATASSGGFAVPGAPTYKNLGGSLNPAPNNVTGLPATNPNIPANQTTADLLELVTTQQINTNGNMVQISINGGVAAGSTQALPAVSNTAPYDPSGPLGGVPQGATQFYYYNLYFNPSVFVPTATSPSMSDITIDVNNVAGNQWNGNILYAVDLIGGDQQYLTVVVPEPASGALLVGALMLAARRRRRC